MGDSGFPFTVYRAARLAGALLATFVLCSGVFSRPQPLTSEAHAASGPLLPIHYAGVDYVDPSEYFTNCPYFTWLQNACYNNSSNPDPPRQQLISDLNFVSANHVGETQRVWISLDQSMKWRHGIGFRGFRPGALNNVDDMLGLYSQFGIKVVLVIYVYDSSGHRNEFRPWALDGRHHRIRDSYLRALHLFLQHMARNATDVATAPIIELANEPYYQFETYFNDPSHLGSYGSCADSGRTNWQCVDQRIIHPWLTALYKTARTTTHKFLYTFSDTTRLFEDYAYWIKMYPEDLIDEHLYDSNPAVQAQEWAQARQFGLPWIATEVGCNVGDVTCTYNGTAAAGPDSWWLQNLASDGAQAVLVDSHVTLWHYPDGPQSQVATPTGHDVEAATESDITPVISNPGGPTPTGHHPAKKPAPMAISNSFDHLALGALHLRSSSRSFTIGGNAQDMTVENVIAHSRPAALSIAARSSTYLARSINWSTPGFSLHFQLHLSGNLRMAPSSYVVLAKAATGTRAAASSSDLILSSTHKLYLSYKSEGQQRYIWSDGTLSANLWYRVGMEQSKSGMPQLVIGNRRFGAGVYTDYQSSVPLRFVAVGDEYSPQSAATSGRFFIDDLYLSR